MRRAIPVVVAVALLAATAASPAYAQRGGGDGGQRRGGDGGSSERLVLNIGHRGASGYAPEHTFPAYDLALRMGADYIEQDLQQTRDGTLVVLHDETLDRTARGPVENCRGPVRTKTLAQIKTCDVGSWFNERYPRYARREYVGLRIPTLREVFERYRRRPNYYIETKSPALADRMEERLLALMDEFELRRPAARRWQVLIQSFAPDSLKKVNVIDPSLPLVQLYAGERTSAAVRATLDAARTYAVGVGPSKGSVDRELVDAAHARCLVVHPYTVNEKAEMRSLVDLGMDGMFTNFPDRLDQVLGRRAVGGTRGAELAARASKDCRESATTAARVRLPST